MGKIRMELMDKKEFGIMSYINNTKALVGAHRHGVEQVFKYLKIFPEFLFCADSSVRRALDS